MAYSQIVVDLCKNPQNVGNLDEKNEQVGTGVVGSPACGDVLKLQIQVNDQGVIEDAKFKTFGCGSAIAASSLATQWLKGKTVEEALDIRDESIAEHLALPPIKVHCSVLAGRAIHAAVEDFKKKNNA
jgi:nitrogen fixation NifU-like protein